VAHNEKKYSLINVEPSVVEETNGVRTTRGVENGEDTILVQSGAAKSGVDNAGNWQGEKQPLVSELSNAETRDSEQTESSSVAKQGVQQVANKVSQQNSEEVPFGRMQAVIVVCLALFLVGFLVYFFVLR
jgi:hypothetical protein